MTIAEIDSTYFQYVFLMNNALFNFVIFNYIFYMKAIQASQKKRKKQAEDIFCHQSVCYFSFLYPFIFFSLN